MQHLFLVLVKKFLHVFWIRDLMNKKFFLFLLMSEKHHMRLPKLL